MVLVELEPLGLPAIFSGLPGCPFCGTKQVDEALRLCLVVRTGPIKADGLYSWRKRRCGQMQLPGHLLLL